MSLTTIVSKLAPKKGCGFDGISAKVSKICQKSVKSAMIKPIVIMVNQMLKTGIIPDKMKIQKIIPTHKKKENENLFTHNRPTSLLPIISKIFEIVIYNQIYNYF